VKHVAKENDLETSVCGVLTKGDVIVLAALESDCDTCREKLMVSSHRTKGCETREAPKWEPQPWKSEKKRED